MNDKELVKALAKCLDDIMAEAYHAVSGKLADRALELIELVSEQDGKYDL